MAVVNWQGMPVAGGTQRAGLQYFCTLRLPHDEQSGGQSSEFAGASLAPYDTFNLGDHVGDDPQAVQANRRQLADLLPGSPVWLEQVHGVEVFDADTGLVQGKPGGASASGVGRAAGGRPVGDERRPVADAAVTATPGRVLCIMTADCLPVLLVDEAATVLGLAHAGWRGLASGVLENTLAALKRRAPAGASWRAWIGPAIGQAAFEVGDEVRHAFVEHDAQAASCFEPGRRAGKWQADLAGLAMLRLKRAGVAQVESSGLCTYARSDLFFSYRRDGKTGRMATLAWLEDGVT